MNSESMHRKIGHSEIQKTSVQEPNMTKISTFGKFNWKNSSWCKMRSWNMFVSWPLCTTQQNIATSQHIWLL